MSDPSVIKPCVLLVSDPDRIAELVAALSEPLELELLISSGGDDTIDLYLSRKPPVVVVTASLEAGDAKSLIDAMREMSPRAQVSIVVVGDDSGPIRTTADAAELGPDRFVTRPLAPPALRLAVSGGLAAVTLVRGPNGTIVGQGFDPVAPGTVANGTNPSVAPEPVAPAPSNRTSMRARWEAIADSMVEWPDGDDGSDVEPETLPPPIIIRPRRRTEPVDEIAPPQAWRPGTTDAIDEPETAQAPTREPTLIIPELVAPAPASSPPQFRAKTESSPPRTTNLGWPPPMSDENSVVITERRGEANWSEPVQMPEVPERESKPELAPAPKPIDHDDLDGLDDFADDLGEPGSTGEGRLEVLNHLLPDARPIAAPVTARRSRNESNPDIITPFRAPSEPGVVASAVAADGRDFARQLRAKMSMMAQRLFQQTGESTASPQVDLAPRHDHHTEIDLAALGEETPLGGGVTEIESRAASRSAPEVKDHQTSPGAWDTQVRERGLPDAGEVVRGTSDAPMLLAKAFASQATCHIRFKRADVEKVVYFDQGRPVFTTSNEPLDRMGELLVREGKITASQYERCQAVVAESGRRMGEILVDFGYLKRRELLPAVRRHVEDILYSLFGWDSGQYQIVVDTEPSAERIRLSRHPAALILEGIRRKLDRSTLERLVGPHSTVIEVPDREKLGGIINLSDLSVEERAALVAIDGQVDLASVARTAGVDVADLLPFAWGLCTLGLATARRTDAEVHDDSTALVGETDLAIDRERVRARWQLVSEADYFALLGVRRDATGFEIRRAYQSARRDFASDCFPSDLRRELAQELDDIANVLDEAFKVLRDDRLRLTYLTNLFE